MLFASRQRFRCLLDSGVQCVDTHDLKGWWVSGGVCVCVSDAVTCWLTPASIDSCHGCCATVDLLYSLVPFHRRPSALLSCRVVHWCASGVVHWCASGLLRPLAPGLAGS